MHIEAANNVELKYYICKLLILVFSKKMTTTVPSVQNQIREPKEVKVLGLNGNLSGRVHDQV